MFGYLVVDMVKEGGGSWGEGDELCISILKYLCIFLFMRCRGGDVKELREEVGGFVCDVEEFL